MMIAILDDDREFLAIIESWLRQSDYGCTGFTRSRDLIRAARDHSFELFILDWNLPDLPGLSVLEWIRNQWGDGLPVLLLTSRSDDEDIVAALNAGADDFISKPVSEKVLLARIQALTRRKSQRASEDAVETYGRYSFAIVQRRVLLDGEVIDLTLKEFQLALMLFRNLNMALARAHIMEAIWGRAPGVESRTLDIHISKVRRKLQLRPENGFIIQPIYGYGYRLEEVGET